MKKTVAFIMMIILMLTASTSIAEGVPFSLHANTHFGMTPEEVINAEKEKGNSFKKNSDGTVTGDATILDQSASISFSFSSEDKLIGQVYYFGDKTDISFLESNYEKVYGTPDCSSLNGESLILPETSFLRLLPPKEAAIKYGGPGMDMPVVTWTYSDMDYYQWLVENEEGFIAIELYGKVLYGTVTGKSPIKVGWISCVEYRLFDKNEVYKKREESADKLGDI